MNLKLSLFLAVLLSLSSNAFAENKKACSAPEYRQFDFWIGDWDVYSAKDQLVGHNKIFPILDGCALSENWTNVKGIPGVSYNFYDSAKGQWHQTWISQTGGALYLNGHFVDGKMVLSGETKGKDGKVTIQRITWTPLADGSVKQHWQVSKDDGKTWTDAFVGFYKAKK